MTSRAKTTDASVPARPKRERDAHRVSFFREVRQNKGLYLMMVPFFVLFFLMTLLPVLVAAVLSLTYYNLFDFPTFIGLRNFVNLFLYDDIFGIALRNTLLFSLITGPLSYLMCFGLAWLISSFRDSLRIVLTFCFYAPALAGTSVYFIWQFIFSGDSHGLINGLLMNIGLIQEPIQWLTDTQYNFTILIIIQLWMCLGTGFLAFVAGFKGVDASLYEAGSIDGVRNRFQELFYITLPMMKPQLLFGAIMQISASFSVSTLSTQLFGQNSTDYSAHTIVLHMMDYGTTRYEMGYACAIAVVLFIIMLIFKTVVNFLLRYVSSD